METQGRGAKTCSKSFIMEFGISEAEEYWLMEETARPNVYIYESHRQFISDYLDFLKLNKRAFSIRSFTKRAGFSSPSFFQSIIQGRRNLSKESSFKIGRAFGLNKEEQKFFDLLVEFAQAESPEEAKLVYERLVKNRNFQKYQPIRKAQYNYFSKWYFPIIRELVALEGFKEDYEWIGSLFQPELDKLDVQRAIDHLERIGMLTRDKDGKLQQSSAKITTGSRVDSVLISRYHEQILERAKRSIFDLNREERQLHSVVVACPAESYADLIQKIERFQKSILTDYGELRPGSNKIFQISVQIVSATKTVGDEQEEN